MVLHLSSFVFFEYPSATDVSLTLKFNLTLYWYCFWKKLSENYKRILQLTNLVTIKKSYCSYVIQKSFMHSPHELSQTCIDRKCDYELESHWNFTAMWFHSWFGSLVVHPQELFNIKLSHQGSLIKSSTLWRINILKNETTKNCCIGNRYRGSIIC